MDPGETYRDMQTKFVSHLSGSSLQEVIFSIVAVPVFSVLLRHLLIMLLKIESTCSTVIMDFVCYILPSLLACTLFSKYLVEMILMMAIMAGVIMIGLLIRISNAMRHRNIIINQVISEYIYTPFKGEHTHVTSLRAYTVICTCICILAVDFIVYPRRFAKTETFGVSFMDIGVGAFIISNAIVSPEGRRMTDNLTIKYKIRNLLNVVKSSALIFVFGVLRLISVKGTNYQEHVTEYGVHWNFFFTLFFVKMIASIIMSFLPQKLGIFPSQIVSFCYEFSLSNLGLMAYILSDTPRDYFVDANREGIFSLAGYLSLYLFGIEVGRSLFSGGNRGSVILMISSLLMISFGIGACLHYNEFQVSRRLANLSYVILCVFITCLALLAFTFADFIKFLFTSFFDSVNNKPNEKPSTSRWAKKKRSLAKTDPDLEDKTDVPPRPPTSFNLLNAVNENGLAYFLVANLLTGLVNFSMQTVRATRTTGFLVILAHSATLTILFSILSILKIKLKCW